MIGNSTHLTTAPGAGITLTGNTIYVPLQFWFNKNPGLALPLIALQYHEVKFNIAFTSLAHNIILGGSTLTGTPSIGYASLYIDYVYLDTDERRQFAQVQHEYLIEQLQYTGAESYSATNIKSKLNLNHPCKFLAWVVQLDSMATANLWSNYGTTTSPSTTTDTMVNAKLQLNGQDRFSVRDAAYFNLVQPYQHFTRMPATGIYVYSFALNPEQHQPSGTVNMSRIDNATLLMELDSAADAQLRVYAVNYNVFNFLDTVNQEIDLLVECF